jgi:hypothetical protein
VKYTFEATPRLAGGFIVLTVFDENTVRMASCSCLDRDYAEKWASEVSLSFPLNSAQVEAELDKAFAAIKPPEGEPIDAEFQVRSAVESRRYEARRERFALAVFRELIRKQPTAEPLAWKYDSLAEDAVRAADALEERLNPTKQILPPYEA